MFLPKSSFSVSEVRCCPGNCLPARRQSLSHLLCLSCEGVGAELSSRMWEWERKGNWGMIVLETWGGCLQVFRFGKGDIHGDLWGLQCNQPTTGKSSKVLRISLSSWSLKWASSLLSLLPINPGLGSWWLPTGSGRTQWPHTKFIAYSIAVGGDIKYFWGVFRLGIPRGYWQWHTYPDTLSPCSEACRRRGLVCSTSEQSPKDRCCSRSLARCGLPVFDAPSAWLFLCSQIHLPQVTAVLFLLCQNSTALAGCPLGQPHSPPKSLP